MRRAVSTETPNFVLRELTVEDATPRYAAWLRDPQVQHWIASAGSTQELAQLRNYIAERAGRDDVLFLGIFARDTGLHIGNIKFEPIDVSAGTAVMGVMIGDSAYRGRGVFREVLAAVAPLLKQSGVNVIELGVHRDNGAAVRAYRAAGFVEVPNTGVPDSTVWMALHV